VPGATPTVPVGRRVQRAVVRPGNAVKLPMQQVAAPSGHRDDPVAPTPDPAAAAATTPVPAVLAGRRVVRAGTRAGALDPNRRRRPSAGRRKFAAGARRGPRAIRPSSRPGSRRARSRPGSTRDPCAPRQPPLLAAPPATRPAHAAPHRRGSIPPSSPRSARPPAAVRPTCSDGSRRPRRRSIVSVSTRPIEWSHP